MKLIGIDFGHGETAAYISDLEITDREKWSTRLQIIDNADKIFSAFYIQNGSTKLFSAKNREDIRLALYNNSDSFRQAFKGSPLSDLTTSDDIASMGTFAHAVYESILEHNPQIGEHEVFVACPSNWTREEAEAYLDLINLAGVPARWIISEAHAALEKHSDRICDKYSNVLIIDFGSSTIDYVAFSKGDNHELNILGEGALPYGANMVDIALAESPKVSTIVQDYEIQEDVLQFMSRIGKEIYYGSKYNEWFHRKVSTQRLDIELQLTPDYERTISYADNSELEEISDFKNYKDQIENLFSNLNYNFHVNGISFDTVILSGSASQMDFVRDFVASTFGPEKIDFDVVPQYVVCSGIVDFARKIHGKNESDHLEIIARSDLYRALYNKLLATSDLNEFLYTLEIHPAPEAKILRSICYFYGIGKKSPRRAFDMLSQTNNLDDYGKCILAYMYYIGSGTEKDNDAAKSILESTVISSLSGIILKEAVDEITTQENYKKIEETDFILQLRPLDKQYLGLIFQHLNLLPETKEDTISYSSSEGLHVAPVSDELDYRELMRKYDQLK